MIPYTSCPCLLAVILGSWWFHRSPLINRWRWRTRNTPVRSKRRFKEDRFQTLKKSLSAAVLQWRKPFHMLAEPPGFSLSPECKYMLFVCMETLQGSFNPLQPSETWSHSEPSSSPATALLQILVGAPGFLLPGGICSLQSPLPNSTDVFPTRGLLNPSLITSGFHQQPFFWLQSSVLTS